MLSAKIGYFRPRGFNPATAGTLNGWWDASDNATITTVSGVVSQWNDKSTNARHLTQGTAANRPGLGTLNGLQCLTLNGTTQHLLRTPGVAGLNGTYFVVWQPGAFTSKTWVPFATGIASPSQSQFACGINSSGFWFGASRGASLLNILGATSSTSPAILTTSVSATAITEFRVNAATYTTVVGGSGMGNSSGITAGGAYINNAGGNFANGNLCEVLWYSGSLSSANITAVTQYLAAKWGITL